MQLSAAGKCSCYGASLYLLKGCQSRTNAPGDWAVASQLGRQRSYIHV